MFAVENSHSQADLVVIGGGLAGLSTAALVAQKAQSVLVLEKSGEVGGRATTQVHDGVFFNLGAHALYVLGHAFCLMKDLNVGFSGKIPNPGKGLILNKDAEAPLPGGLLTLISSSLFSMREKVCLMRFLATIPKLDCHQLDGTPAIDWVTGTFGTGNAAAFVLTLLRLHYVC